jgi:hypothetical protein
MPIVEVAPYLPYDEEPLLNFPRGMRKHITRDTPWGLRPKATLEVDNHTLQKILQRAARTLEVKAPPDVLRWRQELYLSRFYTGDNSEPKQLTLIIDPEGRMTRTFSIVHVRYSQIIAASNAGLMEGDRNKIFLILSDLQAQGGNGHFVLEELVRRLPETLIYIGAVYAGARAIIDTATAGLVVIRKVRNTWAERRLEPSDISKVGIRPRTTSEAAQLLGISEPDTDTLLRALALEPSEDGTWRSRTDPDAEVLRLAIEIAGEAAELYLDATTTKKCLEQIFSLPENVRRQNVHKILEQAARRSRTDRFL